MRRSPSTIALIDRPRTPYNFAADGFRTEKLCSRLSSREVHFQTENGHFAFWAPSRDLGTNYAVLLTLIGKRVVDFLLVIIELFSARCYGWDATSDNQLNIGIENRRFRQNGSSLVQNFSYKGSSPTNHSSCRTTRIIDLMYGIKNVGISLFRFITIFAFDRRTDISAMLIRPCIVCDAVKTDADAKRLYIRICNFK